MTFAFSQQELCRRSVNSVKYSLGADHKPLHPDDIPMWVADCDYATPQCVIEAIQKRLSHPILGYDLPPSDLFSSFCTWAGKHYDGGHLYTPELCSTCPSVVVAFTQCIQAFSVGNVTISVPCYPPFMNQPKKLGRKVLLNQLVPSNESIFKIDFDNLESSFKNSDCYLLCNPMNPSGESFNRAELDKIAELAAKYDVFVISDEIHADLRLDTSIKHQTFAPSAQKHGCRAAVCFAPSKTFNMAGMVTSIVAFLDHESKQRFGNQLSRTGIHGINCLGGVAARAAYLEGEPWLEETLVLLRGNVELVEERLSGFENFIKVYRPKFGFLIWLDCSGIGDTQEINQFFKGAHVIPCSAGYFFDGSEHCVRLNVGCRREVVVEALDRIMNGLKELSK
ncbi:hypothetical protein P9112_011616 [Eukaryota sp. TZLM1-RC]